MIPFKNYFLTETSKEASSIARRYKLDPTLVASLKDFDPTRSSYLDWISSVYASAPEEFDGVHVRDALAMFHDFKTKKWFKDKFKTNIEKYPTIKSLTSVLAKTGIRPVAREGIYAIMEFENHKAFLQMGSSSSLCIKDPHFWNLYANEKVRPLYGVTKNGKIIAMVSVGRYAIRGPRNKEISIETATELLPILKRMPSYKHITSHSVRWINSFKDTFITGVFKELADKSNTWIERYVSDEDLNTNQVFLNAWEDAITAHMKAYMDEEAEEVISFVPVLQADGLFDRGTTIRKEFKKFKDDLLTDINNPDWISRHIDQISKVTYTIMNIRRNLGIETNLSDLAHEV